MSQGCDHVGITIDFDDVMALYLGLVIHEVHLNPVRQLTRLY
jgi:hypothetical protein